MAGGGESACCLGSQCPGLYLPGAHGAPMSCKGSRYSWVPGLHSPEVTGHWDTAQAPASPEHLTWQWSPWGELRRPGLGRWRVKQRGPQLGLP